MNKIKAIIFDFDGTLVESMDIKGRAFACLFKDYPRHIESILALHHKHGGMPRMQKFDAIYNDILQEPLSEEKKEELSKRFSGLVYQEIIKCPFVAGAEDFLSKYYRIIPLFIASGAPDNEIKLIAKDRGLEQYFQGIYGSPVKKKDIILKIISELGLKPREAVFVGDSIDDEEGAKGAGVAFMWRTKENNPFKELEEILKYGTE